MRKENQLLKECLNQLEYLSEKFGETGTGNALIAKLKRAVKLDDPIDEYQDQSNNKYVKIAFSLKIDGIIDSEKEETILARTEKGYALDLENLAWLLSMYENRFCLGRSTFAHEILERYEAVLPSKDGHTAESLFQKYWVNRVESAQKDFDKMPDIDSGGGLAKKDFLLYEIYNLCYNYDISPKLVKDGFLHWLMEHNFEGQSTKLHYAINSVDQGIKDLVDNEIVE
jgi:hypothetical protein